MPNISIDDLAAEIARELSEYTEEIDKEVQVAADKITRDMVKDLKMESPKQSGEYAEGWTRKKFRDGIVVYNKNKPQITHLLENGHVKRGGGRVPAVVHIRPNEEKAVDKFMERVEGVIKR